MVEVTEGEGPTVCPVISTISPGATFPETMLAAFTIEVMAAGGAMLPKIPRGTELPFGTPAAK